MTFASLVARRAAAPISLRTRAAAAVAPSLASSYCGRRHAQPATQMDTARLAVAPVPHRTFATQALKIDRLVSVANHEFDQANERYSMRSIDVRLRVEQSERSSQKLREKELMTGVLMACDNRDIYVEVPMKEIHKDFLAGLYLTSPKSRNHYVGPLYNLRIHAPEPPHEFLWSERAVARNLAVDPRTEIPLDITLVRAAVNQPVKIRLPVVPINEDKCPGLKEGWLDLYMWSVDVILPPYTCPPKCAIIDTAGLRLNQSRNAGDLTISAPGCKILAERDEKVLKIKS